MSAQHCCPQKCNSAREKTSRFCTIIGNARTRSKGCPARVWHLFSQLVHPVSFLAATFLSSFSSIVLRTLHYIPVYTPSVYMCVYIYIYIFINPERQVNNLLWSRSSRVPADNTARYDRRVAEDEDEQEYVILLMLGVSSYRISGTH